MTLCLRAICGAGVHLVATLVGQKCWGVNTLLVRPSANDGWDCWGDSPASSLLRATSEACSHHLPQVPDGTELQVPSAAVCPLGTLYAILSLPSFTSPFLTTAAWRHLQK